MSFDKSFETFKTTFESFLDSLRQIEKEMKNRLEEVSEEKFKLSEEIVRYNNLKSELESKNSKLQIALSGAQSSEERIKSTEVEVQERLLLSKKAQEKLDGEFKILDGQRLELSESKVQLQKRWEALEMEERRLKLFELNLNKIAQDKAVVDRLKEITR